MVVTHINNMLIRTRRQFITSSSVGKQRTPAYQHKADNNITSATFLGGEYIASSQASIPPPANKT